MTARRMAGGGAPRGGRRGASVSVRLRPVLIGTGRESWRASWRNPRGELVSVDLGRVCRGDAERWLQDHLRVGAVELVELRRWRHG